MNDRIQQPQLSSEAAETEEDDIHYLSGKPFFDAILAKSHLHPRFQMYLPTSMVPLLPCVTVPVVLSHGGKNWNLSYTGDSKAPRFDSRWRTFATENHLKLGDACVFELMENNSTNLRFKVHVLRNDDLPPELLQEIESHGKTLETAICID